MQRHRLRFVEGFRVVGGNPRSQAAVMVLAAGEVVGGPENRHDDADQWLFVVSGAGQAIVEGEAHAIRPGTLLLIERGEAHEIRNTGEDPLETLDFYVPPAY